MCAGVGPLSRNLSHTTASPACQSGFVLRHLAGVPGREWVVVVGGEGARWPRKAIIGSLTAPRGGRLWDNSFT